MIGTTFLRLLRAATNPKDFRSFFIRLHSTMNLYPSSVLQGDLSPDVVGADIEAACNEIDEACKGFGTDEKRLITALAKQNAENRGKIAIKYKQMFGKDLADVIDSEIKGDLGTALEFLAAPADVAECAMIRKACKGIGTKEKVLYSIICGRSNAEIDLLKKTYYNKYTKDLGQALDFELGGSFQTLIFTCLQGTEQDFDAAYHTEAKVEDDVKAIYEASQGRVGTDEAALFKIICASPSAHLKTVNLAYAEKHGFTLFKALEKETRGDIEDASLFLLGMKLKPAETVAKLIQDACAGFGTNELLLTTALIRYQPMMKDVDSAFTELYGKNLHDKLKSEARGKYESLLLEVLQTGLS